MISGNQPIYLLDKRLQLLQPDEGLRSTSDAVFLAASCLAQEGQTVLDLGCGIGTAGFCVLARVSGVKVTGIDIQDDHIDLAVKNADLNEFSEQTDFIVHDVHKPLDRLFHHVICNPPYFDVGSHIGSPLQSKAKAKGGARIEEWIAAAHRALKAKGTASFVYPAEGLHSLINAMTGKFGKIEIIPLWPKKNRNAKRVIVRGLKDSRSSSVLHVGLVLHEEDGQYTKEAINILRGGRGLLV